MRKFIGFNRILVIKYTVSSAILLARNKWVNTLPDRRVQRSVKRATYTKYVNSLDE